MPRPISLPVYRQGLRHYRPKNVSANCAEASVGPPQAEARAVLPLLRLRGESIATIRALIDVSAAEETALRRDTTDAGAIIRRRRAILVAFDKLVEAKPYVGPRLSHDHKYQMIEAMLREGSTNLQIRKRTGASNWLVKKLRGTLLGVTRDLRVGRILSAEGLDQARQMLRDGQGWRAVAKHFGICNTKLRIRLRYSKHADPGATIKLAREKRNAIIAALRSGKGRNSICREFRCSCWTVDRIRRELGI